ncbi:MAG: TetR/AcrR family transcriptional regulator [Acidobacteria bacterium]|uniref:TetR/AcrR family transcriptional regulator n=1 Tax=Candidatus Polarisedimenticola svalbardensis TaxID=2886004 RepID=A0A8J6XXN3_9BACT|nr:TetR/AcrR family transcriptional regulator [Candidatus Polarisedimenticola svalbardensis]
MKTITRRPTAERRQEIAEAVIRIIGEQGFPALTTSTLAAEVGLTTGALFRHFPSQEAILTHATRHAAERIAATFPDGSLPAVERLHTLAANRVSLLGPDPGLAWFVRSEQAMLALPEQAAEELRALADRSKRFILAALREGVSQGSIRSDVPAQHLLLIVTGTIHSLIGMSGVQKLTAGKANAPIKVLNGLMQLLAAAPR